MANTHSIDFELSSGQYVKITDAAQTGLDITGDLTIQVHIKPESHTVYGAICGKYDANASKRGYRLGILDTGKPTFVVSDDGTTTAGHFLRYDTDAAQISDGTWVELTVTFDISEEQILFYVNGSNVAASLAGGTTMGATIYDGTMDFTIGSDADLNYFDGKIDEVRIYNRVLSSSEISANYNSEISPSTTGMVGYWKFNNSLLDETTNNNDLTAVNSPVFSTDVPFFGIQANATVGTSTFSVISPTIALDYAVTASVLNLNSSIIDPSVNQGQDIAASPYVLTSNVNDPEIAAYVSVPAGYTRFVFLTDIHWGQIGLDYATRLPAKIKRINQYFADYVFLAGDNFYGYDIPDFTTVIPTFKTEMDKLNCDWAWNYGNHDYEQGADAYSDAINADLDANSINRSLPRKITFNNIDVILVDSGYTNWAGPEDATISEATLSWLRSNLGTNPTFVVLHHSLNSSLNGVTNKTELLNILKDHGNVKAVFFGHDHTNISRTIDGNLNLISLRTAGSDDGADRGFNVLDVNPTTHVANFYTVRDDAVATNDVLTIDLTNYLLSLDFTLNSPTVTTEAILYPPTLTSTFSAIIPRARALRDYYQYSQQFIQIEDLLLPSKPAGMPVWTTSGRPSETAGIYGFNKTLGYREIFDGEDWVQML